MIRVGIGPVLLLCAAACASPVPPQPLPPDDPQPVLLLQEWFGRASQRTGLRGLARLAVDRQEGDVHLRGKQLILLERPAKMRVEVLGFLNQSLAVLVTDGEQYEVYRAENQAYESGEVGANWLWNEAGIALSPEEAVAVLLGAPVGETSLVPARADRDHHGRTRIELVDAGGVARQRVTFDAAGRLYGIELFDGAEDALWSAQFREYRDVEGSPFAHAIQLDVAAGLTHAEISFRDIELNPDLPSELFELRPPEPAGASASKGEGE